MGVSAENKVRFGYGAAFLLLLIAFSYSVFTTDQLIYHIRWVGKTNGILHNLEGLMLEVKELDASFQNKTPVDTINNKGFYAEHFNSIDSLCNILSNDVDDEFLPQKRLQEIHLYIGALRSEIEDIGGDQAPLRHQKDNQFSAYLNIIGLIESKIGDMQASEKALLNLRSQRLNISSGSMEGINIAIIMITLLLAGYSWVVFNNENAAKKNANSLIIEYAQELENKIKELTAANTELTQLRGLQKFTASGRIARMIAHEVRNPLTNINLSCDQLKDMVLDGPETGMLLDTIIRNSNRINLLVSELLNATKSQELKFTRVSVNELLDETLEIARDRIRLEDIRVAKNYDNEICDVMVDADKIKIALLNIVLNAVEAMESGKGVLELKTFAVNNKCVILISDNGRGIDKDSLDKIFEPYFTGKSKGNGLGLTNTQNIILAHKGSIDVQSQPDIKTTFTISLDFAKSREQTEVPVS